MRPQPEWHATRFIAAARQLFLGSSMGGGPLVRRPVVVAGGHRLDGVTLGAFRASCERHGLDLVYFEFSVDRPELGPTNAIVFARPYADMCIWLDCVPWCASHGPLFLVSKREQTSFHFNEGGLVIAPHAVRPRMQGMERARTKLRAVAATITPAQVEEIPNIAELVDLAPDPTGATRH